MFVASIDSTNTLMRQLIAEGNPPEFIRAGYQTAGRGQTGNGWQSEEGKNLLCSIILPPKQNIFELNVVVSVAVQRLLGEEFTIKWPNDIYWQDKKVAGILIENAIIGNEVKYSIAGIGLNVNQTEWQAGAPNPISLKQITGRDYDIDDLMQRLLNEVHKAQREDVWPYYKTQLYRREGFWPFVEREVSLVPTMNADQNAENQFMARIADVLPTGEIVLETKKGTQRTYHFKQIRYVL